MTPVQIERLVTNTTGMYGTIRGAIGGQSCRKFRHWTSEPCQSRKNQAERDGTVSALDRTDRNQYKGPTSQTVRTTNHGPDDDTWLHRPLPRPSLSRRRRAMRLAAI